MLPEARVVHTMPGRLRLRVPAHKGDDDYFARVEQKLIGHDGISDVVTSPLTASILVYHHSDPDLVLQAGVEAELFRPAAEPATPPSLLAEASTRLERLEKTVDEVSSGRFNLIELIFTGLVGAAVIQAIRGQLLGPASTLLSYAVAIALFYRRTRRQAT